MKKTLLFFLSALLFSCEKVERTIPLEAEPSSGVSSREVARMLSSLPIGAEQIGEVFDAVSASSVNGYDEEYTMAGLFSQPGAGVGDSPTKASGKYYSTPLRDLIAEYLGPEQTKASGGLSLQALEQSGLQIYWPWSENWDGTSYPAITFDPGDGSSVNTAYLLEKDSSGSLTVREIEVDENYAVNHPVWVVNSNDDAAYTSLELLRREIGDTGGGDIIIGKPSGTKAEEEDVENSRTLILRSFMATRNYDSWLAGGSEFFIKFASVENFKAATDEEMLLYNPSVTDFMLEVKRKDVGKVLPVNTVVVTDWTGQLSRCPFLISEDDGGTWTSWKAEIELKIYSKTYGLGITIPIRSRDDIVWRGSLSSAFLEKASGEAYRYGDVEIVFEMLSQ